MQVQTSQATGTHSIPSPLPPQPLGSLIFFFLISREPTVFHWFQEA